MIELQKNERIDKLHRNDYVIIQNIKKFCFGIDAVLLSSFAKANKNEKVMDIGTGTGIIPILMCAKTEATTFDAIDIQEDVVFMARKSVKLNNLEEKIKVYHCDIKNVFQQFKKNNYDVITVNPPYTKCKEGILNSISYKTISRHEVLCTFEDIAFSSSKLLKNNGRIYIIHKATRLIDIVTTLRNNKLEPKKIRFIQSYTDKEPNLVLIEAIKNGNPMVKIEKNLIIYEKNGEYTEEVFNIYYN